MIFRPYRVAHPSCHYGRQEVDKDAPIHRAPLFATRLIIPSPAERGLLPFDIALSPRQEKAARAGWRESVLPTLRDDQSTDDLSATMFERKKRTEVGSDYRRRFIAV